MFLCGSAKAEITPGPELFCRIYGLMAVPYAGVIDPLFLRVIACSDGKEKALIISFDLDKAPEPKLWLPVLEEHTGISKDKIIYIGTHTHSAPITTERPREVKRQVSQEMKDGMEAYENMVLEKLLETADQALADMVPARMGYGKGESYINTNRNAEFYFETEEGSIDPYTSQGPNNAAPVDRTVFVCRIENQNGDPIAFFVNYAMHCSTMFLNRYDKENNMGISGDIAGTVSRFMENRFPGCVAVWSSGAAGDVNPVIANEVFYPDPENGSVKQYIFPDSKVINELMISLAARHLEDILNVSRNISRLTDQVKIAGAVEWSETPMLEGEEPYRIRLHLLRLGDVALYGIGGELYSSFGSLIRRHSPLANTIILNHDASLIDDAGYIMDDETMARVRRNTAMKSRLPGHNNKTAPGYIGDSLVEHTESLFHKVL